MKLFSKKSPPPQLTFSMRPDRNNKHSVRYRADNGLVIYLGKDALLDAFGGSFPESIRLVITANNDDT